MHSSKIIDLCESVQLINEGGGASATKSIKLMKKHKDWLWDDEGRRIKVKPCGTKVVVDDHGNEIEEVIDL